MMMTELRRIMIPLVGLQILGKQMILKRPVFPSNFVGTNAREDWEGRVS